MGDVSINAKLFPYRFRITDRAAAELTVEVQNNSVNEKKLSVDVKLPDAVSFDKIGSNNRMIKRFESVKGGEKIQMALPIYLSAKARIGAYDGKLRVEEHLHEFGYVSHSYAKDLAFRVVD